MAERNGKKEAILSAMLDLVVERGFHNAPMSELARRSGASPGVIYHYFPSKDGLIRAIYERVMAAKHEVLFSGYSNDMAPREALLHIWLNAYRFYRSHLKEMQFLDQYLHSPLGSESDSNEKQDPDVQRILRLMQPKKKGGILKDLPAEAIDHLTLGMVASLAKAPRTFSPATLRKIAEAVWSAIADE